MSSSIYLKHEQKELLEHKQSIELAIDLAILFRTCSA